MNQKEPTHRQRQSLKESGEGPQARNAEAKLRRLTLHVTEQERGELARIVENEGRGESVRRMLESFVSDLTNSARRTWPWGRYGAEEWLRTHRAGLDMDRRIREGGEA